MKQNSAKRKSIVISGYYGYRNMGDDAILEMICRDYGDRYDLTVLSRRPEETENLYHVRAINRFDMLKVRQAIMNADLLLSGGGTLLQDKTSSRSLFYYLSILRMAEHYAVPAMLYACGIGPIKSESNLRKTARVLRNVDLACLRDQNSVELLRRLCPGKEAILTADPVFHMHASPDCTADEILEKNGLGQTPMFTVSLRKNKQVDSRSLARMLDLLAEESGCMPVFFCLQDPDDYEAAKSVQGLMKNPSGILEGCRRASETIAVLRRMQGVVSMRLHALIFGALAAVPLVGFGVDPKIDSLLRTLHAPEAIDPKSFDPASTAALIASIMAKGSAPDVSEQVALSGKVPAIVRGLLEKDGGRFVIHIISGGDTGGAKTHVISLLSGLIKGGCRVLLVCFVEGEFAREASAAGIPVKVLPRKELFGNLRWLERYARRHCADAIHCHGARANMYGALLKGRIGIPVLSTVHSDPSFDYLGRPVANLVFGSINRAAMKRIGCLVCVSEELKERMEPAKKTDGRVFRICNGIDFDGFSASVPRETWFRERNLPIQADSVVFGTASRLTPVKDIATLISAFSVVAERYPQAKLLIAGDGSEKERLQIQADRLCPKGSVFFTGWLDHTADFYQAIDVNVISSVSEGFPFAIPEGGRMRCATIATRVGSIPEVIFDGETGLLFEPGDVSALAGLMGKMIDQPALRQELGRALEQKIKQEYSVESMVRMQMEFYDSVCGPVRDYALSGV